MTSPNISTFREVVPYIYSWTTPDIPKYVGWEKIGYTEQDSADKRISQQASQLNIAKVKQWAYRAAFITEDGGTFRDSDSTRFSSSRASSARSIPRTLQAARSGINLPARPSRVSSTSSISRRSRSPRRAGHRRTL